MLVSMAISSTVSLINYDMLVRVPVKSTAPMRAGTYDYEAFCTINLHLETVSICHKKGEVTFVWEAEMADLIMMETRCTYLQGTAIERR